MNSPDKWGRLSERYKTVRPRRMLSLDGGGIRGIITLEILDKVESMLRARLSEGQTFRLCDFFDYIGGTSTGAIIAAGLCRGLSVAQLKQFYKNHGREIFDAACILERWKHLYSSEPLEQLLKSVFGETTTMSPENLECLLMVVVKNITTDSPWPISSNPYAKYNTTSRTDRNLDIPLWKVVRASTAAPFYFPPEVFQWEINGETRSFAFADGGITPYNNPSFQLYKMATLPEYGLEWTTGEDQLLLVSIGTGACPNTLDLKCTDTPIWENFPNVLKSLMNSAAIEQDINCRTVGRCAYGLQIDNELGDMMPRDANLDLIPLTVNTNRAFLYVRYNADLSKNALAKLEIDPAKVSLVRSMDKVDVFDELELVGKHAASFVSLDHFGSFV